MGQTVDVKSTLNGLNGWIGPGQFIPFPDLGLPSVPGCRTTAPGEAAERRQAPGEAAAVASPAMMSLRNKAARIAGVDVPVLLLGKSGSGKEAIARLIHGWSWRAKGPFVKVNCAGLSEAPLEVELFGYEANALAAAQRRKPGQIERANQGTLLLEEIIEMPWRLQARLLALLDDGETSRLGGRSIVKVDARVLAASSEDLEQAVRSGRLRQDLYSRLNVFTLRVPPLRERAPEAPALLRIAAA